MTSNFTSIKYDSEELDELSVVHLELMDQLIDCKRAMEVCLREGYFLLGKTRYILGAHSVSMLQIPHDECNIKSPYKVFASEEKLSEFPSLRSCEFSIHHDQTNEKETENSVEQGTRKRNQIEELSSSVGNEDQPKTKKVDPIDWFSALPPQSLRKAQQCFRQAMLKSAECATIQKPSEELSAKDDSESSSLSFQEFTEKKEIIEQIMESPEEEIDQLREKETPEISLISKSNDNDDIIIEKEIVNKTPAEPIQTTQSNEISTLSMHLGKAEIEAMIEDGSLEKVSEGYYKMKPEKLKDLKICQDSLQVVKPPEIITKPCPQSKKPKSKPPVPATAMAVPSSIAPFVQVVSTLSTTTPQIPESGIVQQAPSYIALMPVNQVPGNTGTLLALPMQQNIPTSFTSTTMPTFVALPSQTIPVASNALQATVVSSALSSTVPSCSITAVDEVKPTSVKTQKSTLPTFVSLPSQAVPVSSNVPQAPVVSIAPSPTAPSSDTEEEQITPITSVETNKSIPQPSVAGPSKPTYSAPVLRSSTSKSKKTWKPSHSSKETSPIDDRPVKSKPQIESTRVKRPFQHVQPSRKRRKTSAELQNDFVSDANSSDEEKDLGFASKSKSNYGKLGSMFFKEIGKPVKRDTSMLDKLHQAIFQDLESGSDDESDSSSDSDDTTAPSHFAKCQHRVVNCPGPGRYLAYVGPGKNSRLSIIRSHETKTMNNLMYELYKVRVTSAGREANTNILIPIPDGVKFSPSESKEEHVEFAHIPHKDYSASNHVSPEFLEKLAATELKLRKYKDEIKALRRRYLELLQEYANRPQFSTISDLVGAAAKFLTEDQLVFFLMQLKAGAHNMQGIRYSVREKVLALSIYQRSPETYKWMRKLFNLPSKSVLDQWLEDVGIQDPQLLKKLMYNIYTTYNFKT